MSLIKNILLAVIAVVLAGNLFPVGITGAILFLLFKMDKQLTWKYFNRVFYNIAKGIDVMGNFIMAPVFNLLLIKINESAYRFGKEGETISSALGKNIRLNNLTMLGKGLNWVLNLFDKNHSIKSINEDIGV